MKTLLKPIALSERSYNVTLLHKALKALGLPVSKDDTIQGIAGSDTLKQVRTLQERLKVPVDKSTLVNEATSLAIEGALKEKGLTEASSSFTVTGAVRLRNGEVKRRQRLLAFDLDLRGVAVYRTVNSDEEIQKNGGFEFLGEAVSDNLGNYSITFYDWQYGQAERKKADVVVYAVDREEIIGRSRMVNSEDHSDKGLVRGLDVIIALEETRTEYEVLMNGLNAFLKESKTSLREIAKSRDQLVFTAGELDVDQSRIDIAASAELLVKPEETAISHELLYGIGRQGIRLDWAALYKKQEEELRTAIAKSVEERIIRKITGSEIAAFLRTIQECAVRYMLDDTEKKDKNTLNAMLKHALPEEKQRLSFVNALGNFKGSDFREFWNKHLPAQPEFKDKPGLISGLLLTQQFTILSGNHQALVEELQVNRKLTSAHQLIGFEKGDWINVIKKAGVPDFIEGKDDEEKMDRYAGLMQDMLNAAFPTQRIAKMVEKNELPIEKTRISKSISAFLSQNGQFNFAGSRIHEFDKEIAAAAGEEDFAEVRSELMKIQRVFQVSTSPEAMRVLMQNNLHAAHSIANIPQKSFIMTYGNVLGGEQAAFAIYQRASYISSRTEAAVMRSMEYTHAKNPAFVLGTSGYHKANAVIENKIPNYSEFFGSPDICECKHCRSVYSAAAYFVELLQFLKNSSPNDEGYTPFDILIGKKDGQGNVLVQGRRPDLAALLLTCENTNTIIPYIDLANEVMEYYTVHGSLANFKGHDTGETTAGELRANPQHFNPEAYRKLNDTKYPFSLPYHQPLDVIRTYSGHLRVSRCAAMKAMNPQPEPAATRAIEAESLKISHEEYKILTGEAFDTAPYLTALHEYYGYTHAAEFTNLQNEIDADGNHRAVRVPVLLERTGLKYTDLVELIKTLFINPYQGTLDYLEKIVSYASIDASTLYTRLVQIEAGTLNQTGQNEIVAILNAYNSDTGNSLTLAVFTQWVVAHLSEFRQVITLYEPESKCDLETTRLRSIQSIYENTANAGISNNTWSKMHRFIRLWRKLGWSIHETDLILAALGEEDITASTISKLESVLTLHTVTKQPLNRLATLWGNIDTYGKKSLYKKLFLNKAVQQIHEDFKADAWGDYLQRELDEDINPITLAKHQPAILAAFRMTEEDLNAILEVARVIDNGNPRNLIMDSDILYIQNLSTIYRYVVLAKALKMRVADMCKLIRLFNASPFSTWDIQQGEFTNISPKDTYEFYQRAASTKEAGFKASVLEYIIKGTLPADSTLGIGKDKTLQTAKTIRDAFAAIEQDHPEIPESSLPLEELAAKLSLTSEILTAKLSLTFQPEIVSRFMGIVEGNAFFETVTDDNLDITIPDDLSVKYTYINGSGRLTCAGVMSDTEQTTLKGLANVNATFQAAVDELYAAPETFISDNFNGVFSNLAEANATLLNHPAQDPAISPDAKLAYIYGRFLPILKNKLRRDAMTQHIAALIGLSEEATALLIAADLDKLITGLSTGGFSATYFSDASWNTLALEKEDSAIDFSWGTDAPDPSVPANNFSVRWNAYIAAPASGEYTLMVEVEEADEAFHLYLDDTLMLEKAAGDANTSWERVVELNASQMHLLTLEYAETSQHAGIRLYWKTAATAPEIISSSAAYPAAILDAFAELATVFHRAAKFILGFEISETELNHFITYNADFGSINFKSLTAGDWARIRDYTTLRNAVPQAQALLTDVFALANTPNPAPTIDQLTETLRLATAWDEVNFDSIVSYFSLSQVDDFKNEIALNRLYEVMQIVKKTGISAETIARWGAAETDFDELHETAQSMKNTVNAKYEEEDWLAIAGDLSDKIRKNQQQALVSYLLMQPAIQAWGARDADGLFEYFLIDVQMGACMDTSRIVQANSSVQMFVNRCLLNLESDMSTGSEKGVSPEVIDRKHWEWMKNYRVWEANRKVFLYPENWLEPEWRNDRSEFFKELESYLVQNDITDRSVEQGLRNYLTSFSEVANLEVCGMYQENYDDGKLKYLHVFARTHNPPYKFFYRTWNEYGKWSAWEKVQVDIRSVEDGDNSGVHTIPVVWKERLFLFWPEFFEKQLSSENSTTPINNIISEGTIAELEPSKYWEIRLAWSEYVDGKWSPKQMSKEFITQWLNESRIRLVADIDSDNNKLNIFTHFGKTDVWKVDCTFYLSDIVSKIEAENFVNPEPIIAEGDDSSDYIVAEGGPNYIKKIKNEWYGYELSFMNYSRNSKLQLLDDVYLTSKVDHKLLLTPNFKNLVPTLDDPFFFSDTYRTYFVRPVDIRTISIIINPGFYKPYTPEIVAESKNPIPSIEIPNVGPDDYIPEDATDLPVAHSGKLYTKKTTYAKEAFGGVQNMSVHKTPARLHLNMQKSLEFHTFYHPFSSQYVTNLNEGGLQGLMESNTKIASDGGSKFESEYQPNIILGLVQRPSDFDERTYYKQNVCFDVYGANSLYNWELFFHAPLYIATRLSKNGKYEEAMKWFHFIFDPTTDEKPQAGEEILRYWKVLPFKTTPVETLEDLFRKINKETDPSSQDYNPNSEFFKIVSEWRDNPFDPHLVASNRPLAYMKHVVIKYVENLVAWGDSLFRQDTMESVNEALQIYVLANHILGPRPEFIPKRGEIKAASYHDLQTKWDTFSNALVALENIFPYSSDVSVSSHSSGTNLLGIGQALYFCIPANEKLLENWDTVADRLFKIRHCQNIDGVERKLALFAPPISPEALIQAMSQGLSLGSILADLSSPPPIYRFTYLIQKANEFCADVKALGSAVLAALEKKEAEELSSLRATHETSMLELVTAIKERQVLDARANKEGLQKSRETAKFRLQHYTDLLGNESVPVPEEPEVKAELKADSPLPKDTSIATIETDVDDSPLESFVGDQRGLKLILKEQLEFVKMEVALDEQDKATRSEIVASVLNAFPDFHGDVKPFGVGVGVAWGVRFIGAVNSAFARAYQNDASHATHEASIAAKLASYIRREQDWTLQANLAAKEIIQLDKQITSADIRIQVAEKELGNHIQQIENAKEVERFLKDKFTNQELYQWMKEQLFAVYKQSYNLAYDMAKKAEKAYKYERGTETATFIQYGYWDNSRQGLVAGEKLQLALRQMEKAYLEENRRELELTKAVSLGMLNPLALIELRETGKCYVSLPEELFDLDFQGHYFRRIKSVSLSIPCIAGPYTTVNCTLRLLNNYTRINTTMNSEGNYEHENEEGLWIDDDRFRASNVPVTSIATSTGQNDAGMFEFNFRDERYLPFEGAGAVSEWLIELGGANYSAEAGNEVLRQFDYSTISDVILHIKYTARENGGLFKEKAGDYIKNTFIKNPDELEDQPFMRIFSMKHEFPTEWHKFLYPSIADAEQVLNFTIGKDRFPFFAQDRDIAVMKVEVFAKCTHEGEYHMGLNYINLGEDTVTSLQSTMPLNNKYGRLHKATINNDAGLDITKEMSLKLESPVSESLATNPDEVEDIFLVLHYKMG